MIGLNSESTLLLL